MRKLFGTLAVLALALLAAVPSTASYPGYYSCDIPSDCPDFIDCRVTGCSSKACVYDCSW
jgi:hypothetical protein